MEGYPSQQAYGPPPDGAPYPALTYRVPDPQAAQQFDRLRSRAVQGMLDRLGEAPNGTLPSAETSYANTTTGWNAPTPPMPLPQFTASRPHDTVPRRSEAPYPPSRSAHTHEEVGHFVTDLALQLFLTTPPERHAEVARNITDPDFLRFIVPTAVARARELYAARQSHADDADTLQRILEGLRKL